MVNKIFNVTSTFKAMPEEDGSIMIRGMASTTDFDRAGDSISADAWTKGGLDNFEKNPIILFNHDYNRPIGRATGVKSVENGLELTAKISKAAKDVSELIKDGVLGAFSVGFRVKDADYVEETDGLRIKEAELFEVSVVSVPCNQGATFSLAKSFDSMEEYEDFKKTFTNSDGTKVQKEINMSEETQQPVDLEAFAKKVAEETAAKIAMKQAEQKAAQDVAQKEVEDKAAAEAVAKAQQDEEVQSAIVTGIESGAEKLMADVESKMSDKDAKMDEIMAQHAADLKEKSDEIEKMRNSKRTFENRGTTEGDLAKFGKDLLSAHILGKITRKGWDTDYARGILAKANIDYDPSTDFGIDASVSTAFEEEVRLAQKVAPIFREIAVNSGATVMPIVPDAEVATWNDQGIGDFAHTGNTQNILTSTGAAAGTFKVDRLILQAYRLISGTFITNDTDEQIVISMLPIITSALARAHAKAIDTTFLVGGGQVTGLVGVSGTDNGVSSFSTAAATTIATDAELTGRDLLALRGQMGKYGMDSSDVAYIVGIDQYYNLIGDVEFEDLNVVGSLASKLSGRVGMMYGSPVISTDVLANAGTGTTAAIAVNANNFLVPRLRGVSIETDYEVAGQRTAVVAAQSLGFNQLVAAAGTDSSCVRFAYT